MTSSASQRPWGDEVISATREGVRPALREVAITLCEWERRRRVRESPRPEEAPVMSQVSGREDSGRGEVEDEILEGG